ncbi:MAG: flagellar biosynthesis protein FlhB [Planctomycetota bacterium]|nr:flagellar biosynthesis protein FlhB [Planctomycetota bacterium]
MADEMGERTEDPTPRRLSEARERGQIAKSQDLSGAIDLIGAALLIVVFGGLLLKSMGVAMRQILQDPSGLVVTNIDAMLDTLTHSMAQSLITLAPFLVGLVVIGLLSQMIQVGFLFTTKPLEPNFEKLNPIAGFGKLFAMRNVVKTGLNTVKMAVAMGIGGLVIAKQLPMIIALPQLEMVPALTMAGALATELTAWILMILLVVGVADWLYQRFQHMRDLRMTKQQVKEERRDMDGDPMIKARRFKVMREILAQRTRQAVPTADVIITNPTHFSVAIKYDQEKMRAPKVVAKGVDHLAMQIRQIAMTHEIPIVERPPLARALYYGVEVGREIPEEQYQAVAEILAYVYRLEKQAA